MRHSRPLVFVTTRDPGLAMLLVRVLYACGVDAFVVTLEEGRKLAQVWQVDAWLFHRCAWRN